ncbi:hypothetical protein ABEB36_013645 [Hypothenemus hampei]|uniref:Uncharacterized protein n=1 Tax=Hypothenemus hampei TaxID=57062 RepID=A0ABD1E7M0_HYPHA
MKKDEQNGLKILVVGSRLLQVHRVFVRSISKIRSLKKAVRMITLRAVLIVAS